MGLNRINNLYNKLWSQQEPFEESIVCKQTLDYYLQNNLRDLKKYLKNEKLKSHQLFENVYIFTHRDGDMCDCKSPLTVVQIDKEAYLSKESNHYDNPIWLPSFKSMLDNMDTLTDFEVFPIEEEWLKSKKVCYKHLCCKNDSWKYLTYHSAIGLRFGYEESDCISNYRTFNLDKVKNITAEYLNENLPVGSLILLEIKKNDLKTLNITYLKMWLEAMLGTVKSKSYEVLLKFNGFNDSILNLYEHKDIRKYVTKLLDEIPEILWFLKERADLAIIYCSELDKNGNLLYEEREEYSSIKVDPKKSNHINEKALNAIWENSYFTDQDVLNYMKEFNDSVGFEIYDHTLFEEELANV